MRFLTDEAIARSVRNSLSTAKKAKLAVAYWGKGASELIGLNNFAGDVEILCDPFSGCCDPSVLSALIEIHEVKSLRGMHAKVYWTADKAILGSANASMSGLRVSGAKLRFEASLEVDDIKILEEIELWFSELFANAELVTAETIKKITPLWEKVQTERIKTAVVSKDLYDVLRVTPGEFENRRIFVIVQTYGDPSEWARKAFDNIKMHRFSKKELDRYEADNFLPFYEDEQPSDWDVRPDDVLIHFGCEKPNKFQCDGMWQTRKNGMQHRVGKHKTIILVDEVDEYMGMRISKPSKARLAKVIRDLVAENFSQFEQQGYLSRSLFDIFPYI